MGTLKLFIVFAVLGVSAYAASPAISAHLTTIPPGRQYITVLLVDPPADAVAVQFSVEVQQNGQARTYSALSAIVESTLPPMRAAYALIPIHTLTPPAAVEIQSASGTVLRAGEIFTRGSN